jgi:hypothetical protein
LPEDVHRQETHLHTSTYVRIRQHTPDVHGYEEHYIRQRHDACIRQHTSANVNTHQTRIPHTRTARRISAGPDACIRQHTSQHTPAYVRRAYHIRERHGTYLAAERLIHEGRRIRNHQAYCLGAWPSSAVGRRLRRGRASIRQIRPEKEACHAYKV